MKERLKILIVRFSSMGDIVLTSPVVRILKKQLNAEVHFLTKSVNIENLDESAKGYPILQENREVAIERTLSNSFGFGGTNASLIFEKIG